MAGVIGNKNAVGSKGGGRKPLAVEWEQARWLQEKWKDDTSKSALITKIKSGHYSIRDMFLFKALAGSEPILRSIADKLLPDKIDLSGDVTGLVPDDVRAILVKLQELAKKADDKKSASGE